MKAKVLKDLSWKGTMLSAGSIVEMDASDVERLPNHFAPLSEDAKKEVPAQAGEQKQADPARAGAGKSSQAKVDRMIRSPKIKKARK